MVIPTYEVIVNPDGVEPESRAAEGQRRRQVFRVPRDQLEAFLHVLTFNNVDDFRVMLEDR